MERGQVHWPPGEPFCKILHTILAPAMAIQARKVNNKLTHRWMQLRERLDEEMLNRFQRGFAGFEVMQSMFLHHPLCQPLLKQISEELHAGGKYGSVLNGRGEFLIMPHLNRFGPIEEWKDVLLWADGTYVLVHETRKDQRKYLRSRCVQNPK